MLADEGIEGLPRGRRHIADQLTRASISIGLNLAEGAGKFSTPEERRFYLTSVGSATGSAALVDVCTKLRLITPELHQRGKQRLERVVPMLVKLARSLEEFT